MCRLFWTRGLFRKKKIVDALQTEERITSKKKRKGEKQINTQTLKKKKKKQSTSESSSEEEEQKTSVTKKPNSNVTKTLKNIDSKKKDKQVVSVNVQPAEEESSSSFSSDNEPTKSNGLQGDAGASSRVLPKHKKIAAAVKKSASSSSGDSSSEGDNPVKAASSSAAKQSQNDDGDSSTNSSSDTPIAKQPVPIGQFTYHYYKPVCILILQFSPIPFLKLTRNQRPHLPVPNHFVVLISKQLLILSWPIIHLKLR